MTNTKSNITLDTVEFFSHYFDMPKNPSEDAAANEASQLIHSLDNITPESTFKVK